MASPRHSPDVTSTWRSSPAIGASAASNGRTAALCHRHRCQRRLAGKAGSNEWPTAVAAARTAGPAWPGMRLLGRGPGSTDVAEITRPILLQCEAAPPVAPRRLRSPRPAAAAAVGGDGGDAGDRGGATRLGVGRGSRSPGSSRRAKTMRRPPPDAARRERTTTPGLLSGAQLHSTPQPRGSSAVGRRH